MTKLSGLVAILDDRGQPTGEFRDLGPDPVEVKIARVVPVDVVKPALKAGEEYASMSYTRTNGRVTQTFAVRPIPPEPPSIEGRLTAIEARLTSLENRPASGNAR